MSLLLDKDIKIEVNPKQSEEIQNILFENKYTWLDGTKKIKHLESKYLFLHSKGKNIRKSIEIETFKGNNSIEVDANEFIRFYTETEVYKDGKWLL